MAAAEFIFEEIIGKSQYHLSEKGIYLDAYIFLKTHMYNNLLCFEEFVVYFALSVVVIQTMDHL